MTRYWERINCDLLKFCGTTLHHTHVYTNPVNWLWSPSLSCPVTFDFTTSGVLSGSQLSLLILSLVSAPLTWRRRYHSGWGTLYNTDTKCVWGWGVEFESVNLPSFEVYNTTRVIVISIPPHTNQHTHTHKHTVACHCNSTALSAKSGCRVQVQLFFLVSSIQCDVSVK